MSTNALDSQGVTIETANDPDTPVTYTAVTEVTDISGPSGTTPMRPSSDLDSTFQEKVPGLQDKGQISMTINYIADDATHIVLRNGWANRTRIAFRVSYTDVGATVDTFVGVITSFAISIGVDANISASLTIDLEGNLVTT